MAAYPLIKGVRLPRPIRRTLYQLDARLDREDMDTGARYDSAVELVLLWLEEKTSEMPELKERFRAHPELCNFSYSGITIRMVSVREGEKTSWAMNFIHPDDRIATRLWETQVTVSREGETVRLFVENSFSVSVEAEEPMPTVPGFVRAISEQIGLTASVRLSDKPWVVETPSDVQKLYEVVTDPSRQLPVVVLSAPDYRKWPLSGRAPDYMVSGDEIARRCFGRCVVVQLPYLMSFRWSEKIGRNWAVFDGGVRLYRPQLDFNKDDIYVHTLYSKQKILGWKRDCEDLASYQCFERFLKGELKKKPTLLLPGQERKTFTSLWQKFLEQQRAKDQTDLEQMRTSYEEQIKALTEEKEFQEQVAEDAFQKYRQYEHECEVLRGQNYNLQAVNEALRDALKNSGKSMEDIVELPDSYEEMDEWCEKYLSGKLEFTNRARRAISKDVETLYQDVALVYRCLLFLGNEYRDTKMGKEDHTVIEEKLKALQVENRPSANETQAGRYEEEYYYTDDTGVKRMADMHLVRGTSRDTRNALRIYYYWDEKKEKVVVVSLTRHLTTAAT